MAIKVFSLKADGSKKISDNFAVREFACKDGSDKILIDDALILSIQRLRDFFGAPATINSAYRTEAHNKKVGGSPNSQHVKGTAADIVIRGASPMLVAQIAEAMGIPGIGHYPSGQGNFTHIDTRAGKSRWERRNGKDVGVNSFGGKSFAQRVQIGAGLEGQTITYLQQYRFSEALLEKLAGAIYRRAAKGLSGTDAQQVQKAAGLDDNTMAYLQKYEYAAALLGKLAVAME